MVASVRPATPARPLGPAVLEGEIVDRLARWLLLAVALDLVLTRFAVRLAMFIPKGEPWATAGAAVGRIGAAADALVPIVGLLLLGALLAQAGRAGRGADAGVLVGIGVVAAAGLAFVFMAPSPAVVSGITLLVTVLAAAAGVRVLAASSLPRLGRAGIATLAASVALAGAARLAGGTIDGSAGLAVDAAGQAAFVLGAGLVGLAGVATRPRSATGRRAVVAGVAVGLVVVAAGLRSPLMWGALAIWSVGLAGAIPTPLVALGLGLAVAGLPVLHRGAPAAATGAAIVLLAGYGLAASGLVLAGLLGLMIAGAERLPPGAGRTR